MFDSSVFATNLRMARKRKGLSQRQLAEQLFLSTQAVSKWEQGASMPDLLCLCKLAQILQVSTDSLLGVTPSAEPALIAVDAGGTKTEFVLISHSGRLIKRLVLGGANPNTCGIQQTCDLFRRGIDSLMQCECQVMGLFIGGAGMISSNNAVSVEAILRDWYPNLRLRCMTDIYNVLAHADTPDNAIAVICGTGNVVFATKDGKLHRFGGGGWRLEQAGSGYDLGRQALLAALEHRDGTGPATTLTESVEQKLGGRVWDNIQQIYREDPSFIASFAPLVIRAWQQQDPVATEIVTASIQRLAHLINTAADRAPKAKQVLLGGSLLTKCEPFRTKLAEMLKPGLCPQMVSKPAVWGACLQCARMIHLPAPNFELFMETYQEEV
ncbi:MAG: XRE family transcriptional regulator [Ruminococcaceae bacterium]|nr:XRE family transcriptional regulator [Oscillospiraceae bacterium]